MKLSTAKYWYSVGHYDAYEGKEFAAPITIPAIYEYFYDRGYFTKKNRVKAAGRYVLTHWKQRRFSAPTYALLRIIRNNNLDSAIPLSR